MSQFAQVKYLSDGIRATVPTKFFKVVFNDFLKPSDLCIGSVYQVFWSPEPEESPTDVMESHNEIIDLPQLERDRKRRLNGGPLKGFYNGLLLSLSHTEDTERELKRELSDSNCLEPGVKRLRAPSTLALEAISKLQPVKPGTSKNASKKEDRSSSSEASRRNLSALFDKCSDLHHKRNNNKNEKKAESEESDDYWKRKHLEEKKKKSTKTDKNKSKIKSNRSGTSHSKDSHQNEKDGSTSNSKLEDSNSSCSSRKYNSHSQVEKSKNNKGSGKFVYSTQEKKDKDLVEKIVLNEDDMDFDHIFKINGDEDDDKGDSLNSKEKDEDSSSTTGITIEEGDAFFPAKEVCGNSKDLSSDSSDDNEITPKKCYRPIPTGKEGDSMALSQFVDSLWESKTLIKRSPTGLAACSKNKKVGYPRMTPSKVKQCEEFLKQRVLSETKEASRTEIDLRVGRARYMLGQKIASLRKAYRRKGIPIPTPEEAHAERKREKKKCT